MNNFTAYFPEAHSLVYCNNCGIVLHEGTIKERRRDYIKGKRYIEFKCPVCHSHEEVEVI